MWEVCRVRDVQIGGVLQQCHVRLRCKLVLEHGDAGV